MRLRTLLLIALLVVPLAEIYVLIQVGQVIGPWWTIALLIAASILGSWLIRREGRLAWQALNMSLAAGRLPDREVLDAGLILVGGALMLAPGFLTDVAGFAWVLPFTRPFVRRGARWMLGRHVVRAVQRGAGRGGPFRMHAPMSGMRWEGAGQQPHTGPVIPGEVVDRRDS